MDLRNPEVVESLAPHSSPAGDESVPAVESLGVKVKIRMIYLLSHQ